MNNGIKPRLIVDTAKHHWVLIGLPLLCALLAYAVALSLPSRYTSFGIVSIRKAHDQIIIKEFSASMLPDGAALTEAYALAAPGRLSSLWKMPTTYVPERLVVTYDKELSLVRIKSVAEEAVTAQHYTVGATKDFVNFVKEQMTESARTVIRARLTQSQVKEAQDRAALQQMLLQLDRTPRTLQGRGVSSTRDALAAVGVDRRFAGDTDASSNPAYSVLAIQIAELRASIMFAVAQQEAWQTLVLSDARLASLAEQMLQVHSVNSATLATSPDWPRKSLLVSVAFVLGLLAGVLITLVRYLLAEKE